VLPLVPGYLSAVSGVSVAELDRTSWRSVLAPSLIFVASFSAIFILLGLTATGLGRTLNEHQGTLEKIAGALIIALGVYFVASLFVARLNREWHVEALMARAGKGGPIVAGAAFAIAWTPCIGPTLGAILTAASISSSAGHAALLLAVYSAGLGIPFLLAAFAVEQFSSLFARMKRHLRTVEHVMGVLMIITGIGFLTGAITNVSIWLLETFPALQNIG
jgi:cytochrome c-type biogenesis protein